jgi:hypothetical protein
LRIGDGPHFVVPLPRHLDHYFLSAFHLRFAYLFAGSIRAPVGIQFDDWPTEVQEDCDFALDETIGPDGTIALKQRIFHGSPLAFVDGI